jgi:CRP-like cAMP-binding protein
VDEINRVSGFSSVRQYKKGDAIFEIDQPAAHFYILMEGLVYLQLPGEVPGFNVPVSKVEKGELFGISPLVQSPEYTSAAVCLADTKVLAVEAGPFLELLQQNCAAGMDIISRIGRIYFRRYLEVIRRLQRVAS